MSTAASRTEAVAGRLRDEILRGDYRAGDRLPAERDLAERLGVNRSSVREALKTLEQLGLVVIRRGDGTMVRHLHEASVEIVRHLLDLDGAINRRLLEQLLDVHEMLLSGATYLAVERGSDAELGQARELVRRLSVAGHVAELHGLVNELVDIITEASGNLVLRLFRNAFRPAVGDALRTALPHVDPARDGLAAAAEAIDAALQARDPAATERAVRALYRQRTERLLDALDALEAGRAD